MTGVEAQRTRPSCGLPALEQRVAPRLFPWEGLAPSRQPGPASELLIPGVWDGPESLHVQRAPRGCCCCCWSRDHVLNTKAVEESYWFEKKETQWPP